MWILAALGTASCFAVSSLIALDVAREVGPMLFSLLRTVISVAVLGALSLVMGNWSTIHASLVLPLVISGILGVLAGDVLRYVALARLGARRSAVLNATSAPVALLLGFLFLDEKIGVDALVGCGAITAGVVFAVLLRPGQRVDSMWDDVRGRLIVGVSAGMVAAISQAAAVLIARPVMSSGADPVAASVIRSASGIVPLMLLLALRQKDLIPSALIGWRNFRRVFLSSITGTALGMTLQLYALANGEAGVVATLSGTTPVIILPLVWALSRQRPPALAWLGAVLVVAGTAAIAIR